MQKTLSHLKEQDPFRLGILLFAACVLIFNNSWVPGMFMDGTLYATLAKNGGGLVPQFQNESFFEHPPFFFIYHSLLFKIFGSSWSVARLGNFFVYIALILTLWFKLKKIKNKEFSFFSILILLLTLPLIKKSRFPNMDLALTYFTTLSFLSYYSASLFNRAKDWIQAGIFFGLALLMKGHPAFIIPWVIFLHLIFSDKITLLLKPVPWASLILGFLIFGIWPLSLFFIGEYEGFQLWFKNQFLNTVIGSRGQIENDYLMYFKFLFKYCAPWFLLTIASTFIFLKRNKKDPFVKLLIVWFWGILLLMSIPKWKLSHYILPVYPALACLAAIQILKLKEFHRKAIAISMKYLLAILSLVLLALPITNKIKRDQDIYKIQELTKYLKNKPDSWGLVEDAYDYWSLASAVEFTSGSKTHRINFDQFLELSNQHQEKKWIYCLTYQKYQSAKQRIKGLIPFYRSNNLVFLINYKLMNDEFLFDRHD